MLVIYAGNSPNVRVVIKKPDSVGLWVYELCVTKGSTVGVPVCSDYGEMFDPCDKFNKQVHGRVWPHRHGGKGRLGERGKFSSFAFGTVLQNTFNAFRDITGVGSDKYEYYCEELARQVHEYTDTLSNDIYRSID